MWKSREGPLGGELPANQPRCLHPPRFELNPTQQHVTPNHKAFYFHHTETHWQSKVKRETGKQTCIFLFVKLWGGFYWYKTVKMFLTAVITLRVRLSFHPSNNQQVHSHQNIRNNSSLNTVAFAKLILTNFYWQSKITEHLISSPETEVLRRRF